MSHSCPNLVSTSFLYNPYIPFFNLQKFFIYYSIISIIVNRNYSHKHSKVCIVYTITIQLLRHLLSCSKNFHPSGENGYSKSYG